MDQEPQPDNQQFANPDNNQITPTEPPKDNKKGILIALAAAVVVVILGIAVFAMMNSGKKDDGSKATDNSATSEPDSTGETKFQNYDVTDATTGITFSVSFYKDATAAEKNGRTFLTSGEEGSQSSVYLGAGKEGAIDCGDAPSTTMRLNGESTTVCYKSDNKQYGGYVTVNGTTVQLNVAGQEPVSMDDAKAIMESATFK